MGAKKRKVLYGRTRYDLMTLRALSREALVEVKRQEAVYAGRVWGLRVKTANGALIYTTTPSEWIAKYEAEGLEVVIFQKPTDGEAN